jgi:hypothetical protein
VHEVMLNRRLSALKLARVPFENDGVFVQVLFAIAYPPTSVWIATSKAGLRCYMITCCSTARVVLSIFLSSGLSNSMRILLNIVEPIIRTVHHVCVLHV